jgi:hypothetical protein
MPWRHAFTASLVFLLLNGCVGARDEVHFPKPLRLSTSAAEYDVAMRGRADFALLPDPRDAPNSGRLNLLAYDDDGDGRWDRLYHLKDYDNREVPHLVILLDSIPFEAVKERYDRGEFRFFDPPQKLLGPFPSLTEQVFTRILHAPPLMGVIDDYFDPRRNAINNGIRNRTAGYHEPWEFRVNYLARYWEGGLSYVDPRDWFHIELARAKKALDQSPDRVTLVYFVSASGMLCKYGRQGLDEVLDGIRDLCLQLLYERQGALKISVLADHGHNLTESTNISLAETLRQNGFNPTTSMHDVNDVVMDMNGLVTYLGIHTRRAAAVAEALRSRHEVELATYLSGDRVIVCDAKQTAAIDRRGDRFRYEPVDGDPLHYEPILESLQKSGKVDQEGFVADRDWFDATIDAEFPDAPRRLWDAFHGLVVNPPEVMLTFHDGYCCGSGWMHAFIHMASTHGGLNQVNGVTFVMTMTGRVHGPMRSGEVMEALEPGYVLPVRPK